MFLRRAMVALTVLLVALTPRVKADIDYLMWDECYDSGSPAPLIMPLGSRITVPCTFLPHSWPMISIRARFCQSEYAGYELVVNVTNGTLDTDGLTSLLHNASWKFVDMTLGHSVSLSFNITDNTTGMFDCLLRNETHGYMTTRFTVITQIETLHRPGEIECVPKLGLRPDGDKIWTTEYNEWQRHNCGTFYGFDRLYYYLAATNKSNTKPPCPPNEPDRCWPVVQRYTLDGDCYRIQAPRRRKLRPYSNQHEGGHGLRLMDVPWLTLGLTVMLIGGVCLGMVVVVRLACGECCRNYERFKKKRRGYRPLSGQFMRAPDYDELYPSEEAFSRSYEELFDTKATDDPCPEPPLYSEVQFPLYSEIKRRL
ncbi:membrane glycoprotein UL141 [Cercopithecine betaherpesvirus 5]|uniref:Membrane glycoprotein UL141 n=1 Tax=Simian cytomegalovirus (strain Colburn) TaxID=50292 RepID=G8XTJ5_SCMVC|nr:membrane glycoprotein UL141 [Cercopithecine betaherpesvirus 5]AEV80487.1 membrane glycoprotein UL141 [Cercopithecine betaherpesvirus 5]